MRDPERIDAVLAAVAVYWKAHPDHRLGQVVCNAARMAGLWDAFYVEDQPLVDGLDALVTLEKRGDRR